MRTFLVGIDTLVCVLPATNGFTAVDVLTVELLNRHLPPHFGYFEAVNEPIDHANAGDDDLVVCFVSGAGVVGPEQFLLVLSAFRQLFNTRVLTFLVNPRAATAATMCFNLDGDSWQVRGGRRYETPGFRLRVN